MHTYIWKAECGIYIGKNAGKRVLARIQEAQNSIAIISPYLSPELLADLSRKKAEGIDVQLVTSSEILKASKYPDIVRQLVTQVRTTRPTAIKIQRFAKIALYPVVALLLGGLVLATKGHIPTTPFILTAVGVLLPLFLLRKLRTYDYSYVPKINHTCLLSPGTEGYGSGLSLFHAKLYIIDGESAYLGSLNYTLSGTRYNFESCVEVTGPQEVQKLQEFFAMARWEEPAFDLTTHGSKFFKEPPN
ncbi:MAG: phospholipase D family protein [Sphaerochaeta sp.]|nr:phospholipase D family protein [Sphaerochaeta sp.]